MAEDACNIEDRLFNDHNITQILQAHLLENFIEDVEDSSATSASSNFTGETQPLLDYELRLLRELLWLLANLANQTNIAFAFAANHLDKQIYLISRNFHEQFTFDTWRVIIWALRMTASTFSL